MEKLTQAPDDDSIREADDYVKEQQSVEPHTVLVVEDNPTNMKLLREILKRLKCATIEAADGIHALKLLDAMDKLPDMIITDIMMPNMDGITLTKWLRHLPRYESVPIIVISAFASDADREAAHQAGCTGYLTKPLEIRPFMHMLSNYLGE